MMKTEGTGRNEVKGREILLNLSHVAPMEAAFQASLTLNLTGGELAQT